MPMTTLARALLWTAVLMHVACGAPPKTIGSSVATTGLPGAQKPAKSTPARSGDAAADLTGTRTLVRDVGDSGATLQVKSIELLRNSLTSCLGAGLTTVTEDMFIYISGAPGRCEPKSPPASVTPAQLAESNACKAEFANALLIGGRKGFLVPNGHPVNSDIVDRLSAELYDPRKSSRAGTGTDGLTDTYLRALTTIANVAAHNCDVTAACDCSTKAKAELLVKKCFPGLDPASTRVKGTVDVLANACAGSALMDRRKAIASMISSYAFASSR